MPVGEEVLSGVVATVEHLPVPAYALDAGGVVLAWNPALARLTGVAGQDVVGRGNGAHALPFTGTPGRMLADLVLGPSQENPAYLSEIGHNGDGLSARLTAEVLGITRTFAVRAAPVAARSGVIGAVELILEPPSCGPGETIAHEPVAPLLRTMRHDIKNELTIVLGYIGLALDSFRDSATCVGLDRAIASAEEIGRLIDLTGELQDRGVRPAEVRDLAPLVRGATIAAGLSGIALEVAIPQVTVTADPVVFSVLEHLFERLFRYSAATVPPPTTIRVTASGWNSLVVVYEDDALPADRGQHPDRSFSRDLARGLILLRDLLALDGIELAVTADPLRLELRIPGRLFRADGEKK